MWYELRLFVIAWTLGLFFTICIGFLMLTGRIMIRGREHITKTPRKNRLILSNHPSFFDPLLLPFVCFLPMSLFWPASHFPWQTPNKRFIKESRMPFLKWVHTILIGTDAAGQVNDPTAVNRIVPVLKNNTVIIFPEGTRSARVKIIHRTTSSGIPIGRPKLGAGTLAYHHRPTVIPILIKGAEKVMPPQKLFPNFFKGKIEIIVGKPISYGQFLLEPPTKETYIKIANFFADAIAALDTP